MDKKKKDNIIRLYKKGSITLGEVLSIFEVSKYQHQKELKNDLNYRESLRSIRRDSSRIDQHKMDKLLELYKKSQNLQKSLFQLKIPESNHRSERKNNPLYRKELFRIRNQRDRVNKQNFLEILDNSGGDFLETYRKSGFHHKMIQSWIKKDKVFEIKKNEILTKYHRNTRNSQHPYSESKTHYKTPKDPDVVKILNNSYIDYHGAFVSYGKIVADSCNKCGKIYLIDNFYYNDQSPTKHCRQCIHCISDKIDGRLRNRLGSKDYKLNRDNYIINVNGNIVGYRCRICKELKRSREYNRMGVKSKQCNSCSP